MVEGDVRRIDLSFHGLKVVGLLKPASHNHVTLWNRAPLKLGQFRLKFLGPHVDPDHRASLFGRVCSDFHLVLEVALGRL